MSENPQTLNSLVLPWKLRLLLRMISAITNLACRSDGTVNRRLLSFLDSKVPPSEIPVRGVKTADITVDPTRNLWFRVFTPTEPADDVSLPVIVFFHGGGFALQSVDNKGYDFIGRRMALKASAVVVSVNYRFSPEHRFPAQYDDGFDTLLFLDGRSCKGFPANADLSRCFIAGDSAGANLAHQTVCRAAKAEFRNLRVIGLISIQPFFGGEERTESEIRLRGAPLVPVEVTDWMWKAFLPEGSNRDHEVVNVSGPNAADISGLKYPTTLLLIGGFDPLQDWQRRYYEWLKRSGKEVELIEYPNAIHAAYAFPELPESSLIFTEIKNFVANQSRKMPN
ncbi:PREDICTED: probable carboxylesterase 18 [Nelumbo nucifera]|uniref:Probable carboxylesterase 18 n=1 Tax=Nelumbo nucifera TaxID=4432 RepID=A0A1U7Z5E2_NELNU|nr:PREDICTED: probable carboxylesterase 18 [Nelumbo nucifera]